MKILKIVMIVVVAGFLVLPGLAQATYPDSCIQAQINPYDLLQKAKCFWDMMTEVWKNGGLIGPSDPDAGGV